MGQHALMGEGEVVSLPIKPPRCDDCDHASFSSYGIFCLEFREEIWNPKVAEECAEFLPLPTIGKKKS